MNKVYSGYEIELNKEEDKAYKAKILKIEGNSYQETRDEVAGTTVSGDFISISDAQDLPITKFNIEGKSVQETRDGYNKFDAGNLTLTNTTQMSQSWENDVLTVTSAGLDFALARQNITDLVKNNPGQSLTFDFEDITFTQLEATKSSPIQMNIYFSDGTATQYWGLVNYQSNKFPYTIPDDTSNISSVLICVYSWNGSGNDSEFTTTVTKPMLYLGTEEKEYERYGKTPSIEYKAPVESVGDNIQLFDISTVTTNKFVYADSGQLGASTVSITSDYIPVAANETYVALLDYETLAQDGPRGIALYDNDKIYISGETYTSSKKGFTFTPTQSGYLRFSYDNNCTTIKFSKGTSTGAYSPYGQGSIEIVNSNKNLFNKDDIREKHRLDDKGLDYYQVEYFVSNYIPVKEKTKYVKNTLISTMQAVSYYDKDKNHIKRNTTENPFTTPEGTCYIRTGDLLTNLDTLQLEEGSTATEYVEHQSQTKALYTQQPFRGNGDVQDMFVKKAVNWYEQHNYNTKLITGDEAWIYVESTKTWYVENFFTDKLSASEIKTTHYPCMLASQTADMQDGYMAGNKGQSATHRIYLKDLQNAPVTLAEFKPWIKNLNIVVYYQLNTPLLIPCTPEQVEVLEGMKTYEGVNHIYTTDKLKPTISLRYNYIPALPSLDGESSISSVGDDINLFDKNNANILDAFPNGETLIISKHATAKILFISCEGNTIYTISKKPTTRFQLWDSVNLPAVGAKLNKVLTTDYNFTGASKTITTSENARYLVFYYYNTSSDTISEEEILNSVKICKGTKPTPYSPYGQGSIAIKQNNENLLDLTNGRNGKDAGITSIKREDGSYTFEGTATGLAINIWYLGVYSSKEDTPVLFTLQPGTYYIKDCKLYSKTTHIGGNEYGQIKTFTKPQNVTAVRARDAVSGKTYNEIVYPIIARSNVPVDFVPHQGKTRILYTQKPFRRNEEVSDLFIKKEYRWYEQHNIKRKIFDGTETWSMNYGENLFSHGKLNDQNTKNSGSSNYFKFDNRVSAMSGLENNEFALQPQYNGIFFKNTEISSVEEWIAVLVKLNEEGRPLYVDYVLAEPELIPCTPQQSIILDQLENIQLYDGVNYIHTTDSIEPLLTLEIYNMIEDYDLYVSNDGYFGIPGTDIKFLVNFHESNLPTMPEAVEASVRAAGRDGDYVLNTTYEPLPFEIVCYTEDNLTPTQKKEIESKVNRFLNSIKNRTKKIAFEKGEKFYNVKYNGLLTTTNYPAHLKFSIPLKSSESFGKDAYQKVLSGNSTEVSDTVEEVGALITIYGPATLPIIALNDYSMEYDTAILEGARVEIDTAKSTATHINSDGVRTNVMRHYNHQFPKIQPGENTLKVLSGVDDENNVTVKWNDLKL